MLLSLLAGAIEGLFHLFSAAVAAALFEVGRSDAMSLGISKAQHTVNSIGLGLLLAGPLALVTASPSFVQAFAMWAVLLAASMRAGAYFGSEDRHGQHRNDN